MNITIWRHNSRFLWNVGMFLAFHIALPTRGQHCFYSPLTLGYLWFPSFRQLFFATSWTVSIGSQCFGASEIKLFFFADLAAVLHYILCKFSRCSAKTFTRFPKWWEAPFESGKATFHSLSQTYWASEQGQRQHLLRNVMNPALPSTHIFWIISQQGLLPAVTDSRHTVVGYCVVFGNLARGMVWMKRTLTDPTAFVVQRLGV
jgi:hypothetical protein